MDEQNAEDKDDTSSVEDVQKSPKEDADTESTGKGDSDSASYTSGENNTGNHGAEQQDNNTDIEMQSLKNDLVTEEAFLKRHVLELDNVLKPREKSPVISEGECELSFEFLQSYDSAKEFVSRSLPAGADIIQETLTEKKGGLMDKYGKQFRVSIKLPKGENDKSITTELAKSWVLYEDNQQSISTLDISSNPENQSYKESKPVVILENTSVSGGSLSLPTKFTRHWSIRENQTIKACFENDRRVLSIIKTAQANGREYNDYMNFDYEHIKGKVIVRYDKTAWSIYLSINNAPKLLRMQSRRTNENLKPLKTERLTDFHNVKREWIGKTSAICLMVNRSPEHSSADFLLHRLKQCGFAVVFAGVKVNDSQNTGAEDFYFDDPELDYAWASLLSYGYQFTDIVTRKSLDLMTEKKGELLPDQMYVLWSIMNIQQFFDFEGELKACLSIKPSLASEIKKEANHVMLGKVIITPTREIVLPKQMTRSNILTHENDPKDFLHIVFRDEDYAPLSVPERGVLHRLKDRMQTFLDAAFTVGKTEYEYLLASESSKRKLLTMWYYRSNEGMTCMRDGMGLNKNGLPLDDSDIGVCKNLVIMENTENSFNIEYKESFVQSEVEHLMDGTISLSMAQKITDSLGLKTMPSFFHVIYMGYRSVVQVEPDLGDGDVIVMNKSNRKFQSTSTSLYIVGSSQPEPLQLDPETIIVMSSLGTPDNIFLELQQNWIFSSASKLLQEDNLITEDVPPLNSMVEKGLSAATQAFNTAVLQTSFANKIRELEGNLCLELSVEHGRTLHGFSCRSRLLKPGSVFLSYTINGNAEANVVKGKVLVMKPSTCKDEHAVMFNAVDIPEYRKFQDCIIFPEYMEGNTNRFLGMFCVCWEKKLFPKTLLGSTLDPFQFCRVNTNSTVTVDTLTTRLINDHHGHIQKMFLTHADMKDVHCPEGRLLASLYDGTLVCEHISEEEEKYFNIDRYPDYIAGKNEPSYTSNTILGQLYRVWVDLRELIKFPPSFAGPKKMNDICPRPGYKNYIEKAELARLRYSNKLMQLMLGNMKISESSLTFRVPSSDSAREGNCNFSMSCLKIQQEFCDEFYDEFRDPWLEDEQRIDKNEIFAKSFAWSYVTHKSTSQDTPITGYLDEVSELFPSKDSETDRACMDSNLNKVGAMIVDLYAQRKPDIIRVHEVVSAIHLQIAEVVKKYVSEEAVVSLDGLPSVSLINNREHSIDVFIQNIGKARIKEVISHMLRSFPGYEKKEDTSLLLKQNGETYCLKFSQNKLIKQRTDYIYNSLECHQNHVIILQFFLDWAQRKNLVGNSRTNLFNEITFVLIILDALRNSQRVKTEYSQAAGKMRKFIHTNNVSNEETATSVLYTLQQIVKLLRSDESGNISIDVIDSTNILSGQRHLISDTLHISDCDDFVKEALVAYCRLAVCNFCQILDMDNQTTCRTRTYILSETLWESVLISSKYTERRFQDKSRGASVHIRLSCLEGTPGYLIEAQGDKMQLLLIDRYVNTLQQKTLQFSVISPASLQHQVANNAFRLIFEGAESTDDKIRINSYNGKCHIQHREAKLGTPVLCPQEDSDNPVDLSVFESTFDEQFRIIQSKYKPNRDGPLRVTLTFGTYYLINVESFNFQLSIKELVNQLNPSGRSNTRGGRGGRGRGRGRGRGSRDRVGYGRGDCSGYHDPFGERTFNRRMRSSFIPLQCDLEKVDEFLRRNYFKQETEDERYLVNYEFREFEGSTLHRATIVLDSDLQFLEFRLRDLQWLIADVVSNSQGQGRKNLDTRCKVTSRRRVPIHILRNMSGTRPLTNEKTQVLVKDDSGIKVHYDFRGKVDYVRLKRTITYKCDSPKTEKSTWKGVELRVAEVTEFTHVDPAVGKFLDIDTQQEVSVIPKIPQVEKIDVDWKKIAGRIWEMMRVFSEQFDL